MTKPDPQLSDYPIHASDKVRFSDTDKFGHVSNAVFAVYLETGRGEFLHGGNDDLADPGCHFVLARTEIDYLSEIHWPGEVQSGLAVEKIGRSSVTFQQSLFQDGKLCAAATSVLVHFDAQTRSSKPLSDKAKTRIGAFLRGG